MEAIKNKRAYFDYEILEKLEAGMVLSGHEVKSVRANKMSLAGSYVVLRENEAYLINATIAPYQPQNNPKNYEPTRSRKLLLHNSEIKYLTGKSQERGLTLIPLRVYSNKGKIKLEFGIGRGRKKINKKDLIARREVERDIQRELKARG